MEYFIRFAIWVSDHFLEVVGVLLIGYLLIMMLVYTNASS